MAFFPPVKKLLKGAPPHGLGARGRRRNGPSHHIRFRGNASARNGLGCACACPQERSLPQPGAAFARFGPATILGRSHTLLAVAHSSPRAR
jgi:hypothetical protein